MLGFERSDDYQPLFWVRGRPVHVTTLLVFLHLAALIVCSMFHGVPAEYMELTSEGVFHRWMLWQPFTYAFAHVLIDLNDTLWFLFEMVFLFMWGREVERYFGRKIFIGLYVSMLLAVPAVLLTYSALKHVSIGMVSANPMQISLGYRRSDILHLGLFVAFATIYPSAQLFGGIAARWVVTAILLVFSAALFSRSGYYELAALLTTSTVAFFYVRYASTGSEAFGFLTNLRAYFPRRTPPRDLPARLKPRRAVDTPAHVGQAASASVNRVAYSSLGHDVHESIDPLLDKISKHGLSSLTNSERATLERARVSLLRKERGG